MAWTEIVLLIGIGFIVGFVGTLIGAGGGFILTPILLLIFPTMRPEAITSISLGVIFLNAGSGSIAYARMKRVDYRSALVFALATLPGAIIGAFLTSYIPRTTFNILLGSLLIIISLVLLVRPHFNATSKETGGRNLTHRSITDNKGQRYEYSFNAMTGIIISFFVGCFSSLLGIGGGIIHVPALNAVLNFPVHIATATSHLILAIMALAGTVVHIIQGNLNDGWVSILYVGIGVIGGAQLGAYASHHVKPHWIIRSLAFALLLVGVRIIFI